MQGKSCKQVPTERFHGAKHWLVCALTIGLVKCLTAVTALATPDPTVGFQALFDDLDPTHIPPDTNGAVGPERIVVPLNSQVLMQDKLTGFHLSGPVDLQTFWSGVPGTLPRVVDPVVVFDPYTNRWFFAAMTTGGGNLLLAVSNTPFPRADSSDWYEYGFLLPTGVDIDQPKIGFNGKWIVVQADVPTSRVYSLIYVFDKAPLEQGLPPRLDSPYQNYTVIQSTVMQGGYMSPARTYDANLPDLYLLQSNPSGDFVTNLNALQIFKICGDRAATAGLYPVGSAPSGTFSWTSSFDPNPMNQGIHGAPQIGATARILVNDDRINSCVYRNGSLWAAHTVFLPATTTPTVSAVQWWQISVPLGGSPCATPTASPSVVQRGVIGQVGDTNFRGYPSVAVNVNEDILIGYGIFSATSYPSAAYEFRLGTDPPFTLQLPEKYAVNGIGTYLRNAQLLRWGDYSATAVDPVNDRDMWTIQEASGLQPQTGNTPWDTYWNRISKIFGRFTAGIEHSFGQRLYGNLMASGQDVNGQLGNDPPGDSYRPVNVVGLLTTIDVAAGEYNSLAANIDGTVYAWGSNQYGLLGNGTTGGQANFPTPVPNNFNLFTNGYPVPVSTSFGDSPHIVSSNYGVCAAVDSLGQVWTWGLNESGQLGDGTRSPHYVPMRVQQANGYYFTNVVSIAAGEDQMVALKADGTVWAWGNGCNGALGDGSLSCINHYALNPQPVIKKDGTQLTNVGQVVCGGSGFALALTKDGMIFGWGANKTYQLGLGTQDSQRWATYIMDGKGGADRIAAGAYHGLAHCPVDHLVYAWGANDWGQCGVGSSPNVLPTPAPMGSPNTGFTDIAAGAYFSLMIQGGDPAQVVYATGDNKAGQLGLGTNDQQYFPTRTQY